MAYLRANPEHFRSPEPDMRYPRVWLFMPSGAWLDNRDRLGRIIAGGCGNEPKCEQARSEGWVDVLTGEGILRLFAVMPDPTVTVPAAKVIRSTRATLGLSRQDLLRRIAALETRLASLEAAVRAISTATPRETPDDQA
jgi:hypothetical protein